MTVIDLIDITLFDIPSRRLQRQRLRVARIVEPMPDTIIDPDIGWVFGHWDAETQAVDPDGNVVEITDPPQPWLGPVPTKDLF